MTRYMIRATDPDQFQQAKAMVDGRTRVYVTSERRLFLSTGPLPDDLRRDLLNLGTRINEERPHHLERGLERGTAPGGGVKDAAPVAEAGRAPDIPPLPPVAADPETTKREFIAWMRQLPPLGVTWTREDKYRDLP
ncbi:hypothetical protein [Azospirillum sp.]|uniref:hypothetical protein n=1 Tax=Azospirillum sp. TaxID=34012 RepID=UPI002D2FAF0E|nr:hypothetical protein [Azospirillum sp.]HYD66482.1 hypothetical protein [Azospirillum sp.]